MAQLEASLAEHKRATVPNKGLPMQNYKEKETYLLYEVGLSHVKTHLYVFHHKYPCDPNAQLKRYQTYVTVLSQLFATEVDQVAANCYPNGMLGAVNDEEDDAGMTVHQIQQQQQQPSLYQPLTVNLSGSASANNKTTQLQKQPQIHPPLPVQPTNRYSYRAAIYRNDDQHDLG